MRSRARIKLLTKEVEDLQHRLDVLSQQHRRNLARNCFLQSLAEGLEVFSLCQAVNSLAAGTNHHSEHDVDADRLQSLTSAESALLQQLEHSRSVGSCSSSISDTMAGKGVNTISPCNDPMAHFKQLLQQTAKHAADMADMTAEQLALEVQQSLGLLSIQLNKLQLLVMGAQAAVAIKDVQDRYWQALTCLTVMGKADVIAKLQCFNLETLQSDPSFLEAATQHTLRVAPQLGLTEQQGYAISTGMDVYLGLMASIQSEQAGLKTALAAAAADTSHIGGSHAAGLDEHVQPLEEQQQLYQRLQLLLRKEYSLQFAMCGWLVGRLSYEQLAKAAVLCWPYVLRVPHLGVGIQTWYRQSQ